jgi:hypothetical protein
VFVLTHSVLDEAHAALRFRILDLSMRSASGKSYRILSAPREKGFTYEFVVCANEFELLSHNPGRAQVKPRKIW